MTEWIETNCYLLIIAAVAAYLAYGIVKNKGFRGLMFGGRLVRTLGQVEARRRFGVTQTIKVHLLKDSSTEQSMVGLELSSRAFLSWSMVPVTLSYTDATQLAQLLLSLGLL